MRSPRRLRVLAPLALVAGLFLSAFPAQAHRPAASGGTLTIGATNDALTLDPAVTTDEASGPVEDLLFNSLVKFNAKVQIVPDLASSWNISKDGLTYTFHLHPNVTFHDGTKMAASDVVASFARLRDPKTASPWASFFTDISSVTAPDASTVVVKLAKPYAPFLAVVASFLTVSSAKFVAAHNGKLTRVEDGTGPYMLKSWVPNTSITLVKNPHYFIAGEPHFDTVVFQISTMSIIVNARDRIDPQNPLSAIGDRLLVAPRSATVRTRLGKSQALKSSINYLECPTCHTAIDLVRRESGPAIVHTLCLDQVQGDGIRAIDLGRSFGVEQFVIAYKASTVKQSVMRDLLEWLTR